MSVFAGVFFYPPVGAPDKLFGAPDSTPSKDAFLRSSRPVCELYSRKLAPLGVEGHRTQLMLTPWVPEDHHGGRDPEQAGDEARVSVWAEKPWDLHAEMGHVHLPGDLSGLDAPARAQLALDVVHEGVRQLAGYRGWDPGQFDACYHEVRGHNFVFDWASPWKTSPSRRHRARASFILAPHDGFGRVRLEIAVAGSEEPAAVSSEAVAYCTAKGLERAAQTLRWRGARQVTLTPYCPLGEDSGHMTGTLEGEAWDFMVRDDVRVAVPDETVPAGPVPRVVHG